MLPMFLNNLGRSMANNNAVNKGNNSSIITNIANGQTTIMPKNVCEGCHMSGKGSVPQAMIVQPHLNGGNYCLVCHNFSHGAHPMSKDVTCEKCHGSNNLTIPISGPNIVCINCHDYPNPLNKSLGNLLTIHRPREINCIDCHIDRCTKCHKEIGNDTIWENRITHFRTILGSLYNGS